ncbi:hypothetical protein BDW22DRAFT_244748 [Trametopsis cervina]|nr:hypothetical protein BDW22DRAFT_244748 [Trametopsis cervina]
MKETGERDGWQTKMRFKSVCDLKKSVHVSRCIWRISSSRQSPRALRFPADKIDMTLRYTVRLQCTYSTGPPIFCYHPYTVNECPGISLVCSFSAVHTVDSHVDILTFLGCGLHDRSTKIKLRSFHVALRLFYGISLDIRSPSKIALGLNLTILISLVGAK